MKVYRRIKNNCCNVSFKTAFAVCIVAATLILSIVSASISCQRKEKTKDDESVPTAAEKSRYNFLLMGVDASRKLADVIMLVSLDTKSSTVSIAQIPRDTYAEYTSSAYRKLNGAISTLNGGRNVADFLEKTMGIVIDHYMTVDLDSLGRSVDLLGGVEVNIPYDMSYTDSSQELKIELKAGRHRLNGEEAKQFVRYRSGYVRGDIARLDAQKIFLAALGEKLLECSPAELLKPMAVIVSGSDSSLSLADCMFFISKVTEVEASKIFFMTIPGGDIRTENGAWYYVINKKQTVNVIEKYFSNETIGEEFDVNRAFTGTYSKEFNTIYDADTGYEIKIHSADEINRDGLEIKRKEN